MPVFIHEFSRAFDNIHQDPLYGWVSGGYAIANPIFRESHTVPDVIVKAVKEDKFAINDNYRPYPDKYALIARDVYDIDYFTHLRNYRRIITYYVDSMTDGATGRHESQ